MGIPLPRKREFEVVIMVEVLIEEMFGSDRSRPTDYRRGVVIDAGSTNTTDQHTLQSECRRTRRNNLTEPTLLEMSGNPTNQELTNRSPRAITNRKQETSQHCTQRPVNCRVQG